MSHLKIPVHTKHTDTPFPPALHGNRVIHVVAHLNNLGALAGPSVRFLQGAAKFGCAVEVRPVLRTVQGNTHQLVIIAFDRIQSRRSARVMLPVCCCGHASFWANAEVGEPLEQDWAY